MAGEGRSLVHVKKRKGDRLQLEYIVCFFEETLTGWVTVIFGYFFCGLFSPLTREKQMLRANNYVVHIKEKCCCKSLTHNLLLSLTTRALTQGDPDSG